MLPLKVTEEIIAVLFPINTIKLGCRYKKYNPITFSFTEFCFIYLKSFYSAKNNS